uniref:Uncharacterized protein n=1 Tax=Arundo donax TaxID=35708 RepID=A0A0A8ZCN8_ARUDO
MLLVMLEHWFGGALAIRKLSGILALLYYLGCIYIFWSQSCPRITKGVVAWLVGKYLRYHQVVLAGLFTVLVCVLEVQTHKRH